uniref:SWAP70 N-terminal EF-hand domain-containing protein n=1 Tax=Neogobius melanostomus TaxID=47308 RepID=A0A8C6SYD6_9GOBI
MWDPEEFLKCIWHAFTALDMDRRGKVSKSQLKVLSLNVCNIMKIPFDPCVLEDHFKDDDTGPLSEQGYMRYLSNFILNKPQDDFATLELFKFCWTLSYKKNLSRHLHISRDDAFKVWCIFNFLSENKYPLFIITQEVEYLLKLLTNAMGDVWSEGKLAEYHVELSLTKSKSLTAWELIELVGVQLFKNKSPSALTAAINEVFEELILGILKQVLETHMQLSVIPHYKVAAEL